MNIELINKVHAIFGSASPMVLSKFEEYCKQEEWISHEKVLNAILKLSNVDISKIEKFINMSNIDHRDVVMLAEEDLKKIFTD